MVLIDERWKPKLDERRRKLHARREEALRSVNQFAGWSCIVTEWFEQLAFALSEQRFEDARDFARELVSDVDLALFGKWRANFSEQEFKDHFNALGYWGAGTAAAVILDDWPSATRFSQYIVSPLVTYPGYVDAGDDTDDMRESYKETAQLLISGKSRLRVESPYRDKRANPQIKLLRACIAAINDRDMGFLVKSLDQYLRDYQKRKPKKMVQPEVCEFGTIYYHLGRNLFWEDFLNAMANVLDVQHGHLIANLVPVRVIRTATKQRSNRKKVNSGRKRDRGQ